MRLNKKIGFILATVVFVLSSCANQKKIVYLQDIEPNVTMLVQEPKSIKLIPGDKLTIIVHSRDKQVAEAFNLMDGTGEGAGNHSVYTVDDRGYIDMPVLGPMKVEGLTRQELEAEIKYKLLESHLIKEPVVTVDFTNLGYYVLGEVGGNGRHEIKRDNVTLLEAIAEAGDIGIQGRRDNILVLRTENGKQTPYRVSLLDTKDLYSSPVYYVKQNDIIYVEPNAVRTSGSTANGSMFMTWGFWVGIAGMISTVVVSLTK